MSTPLIAAFGIGAFGALAVEAVRVHQVQTRLFDEINSKKTTLDAARVRFPKYYWLSFLVYAAVGGILAALLPLSANPLYFLYVGACLPKFLGFATSLAEKSIPGAIEPPKKSANSGTDEFNTDDTSVNMAPDKIVYRVGRDRFRPANGLYRYISG